MSVSKVARRRGEILDEIMAYHRDRLPKVMREVPLEDLRAFASVSSPAADLYQALKAFENWKSRGRMRTFSDLREAVDHGAVQRIRPKTMAVVTTFIALVPILWSTGTGADVMRRIAAPMVGGMVSATVLTLVVIPALFLLWRSRHPEIINP